MKTNPYTHQIEATEIASTKDKGIFHLPTGTGKSLIQCITSLESFQKAKIWVNSLEKETQEDNVPVYVILSPRIILSNQLLDDIHSQMHGREKDNQYLIVHSGGSKEDNATLKFRKDLPYRQIKATTRADVIKLEYQRACREKVPLIISGTYDSAEKIVKSGIPVYMLHCDEAHRLVGTEFNWITTDFPAERIYFYTATMRETNSNGGIGMNNNLLFGEIIFKKTPLEMIMAGIILRPRIHLVDCGLKPNGASDLDLDVSAIIDAFRQHRSLLNIGPKMLVVAKGSKHLNDVVTHPKIIALREIRPNLKIFDITSAFHPRINGAVVKRNEFLSQLKSLKDEDEAIILHVRILTEGIDCPGITAVMPMNNMQLGDFLQTLGRATRLHAVDRKKIHIDKTLLPDETERFIKPYAWIIIPVYGQLGIESRENIKEIVRGLRTYGFNASEIVMVSESKGVVEPKTLEELNQVDRRANAWLDEFIDINHEVEEKEKADDLELDDFRLEELVRSRSIDENINRFKLF